MRESGVRSQNREMVLKLQHILELKVLQEQKLRLQLRLELEQELKQRLGYQSLMVQGRREKLILRLGV